MNKNTLMTIVLVVLVAVSVVQAFQLNSLKQTVNSEDFTTAMSAQTPKPTSGGNKPALPSSLENLPQMVGGC
jgi:regulatory protein YycH of two-component signal transduction system YycFG